MIQALLPHLNPSFINVDFKQAAIALREIFSNSVIGGCFFHLLKNFKKQLGEAGLMEMYRGPATSFAHTSGMLMSLVFVPLLSVYEYLLYLKCYLIREVPSMEPVIEWLAKNYVGNVMREAIGKLEACPKYS